MEDFVDQKKEIFQSIKIMQRTFDYGNESAMLEYAEQMTFYIDEFTDLLHNVWKRLMGLELSLFDRIEESNLKFERILTDLVNAFIEQAQGLFTICRNLECTYMEKVNDAALKIMSLFGTDEQIDVADELKPVSTTIMYLKFFKIIIHIRSAI